MDGRRAFTVTGFGLLRALTTRCGDACGFGNFYYLCGVNGKDMTRDELKKWLFTLEGTLTKESDEEIVAWIMDALKAISCTINVEKIMQTFTPALRNILYIVAYGTPDLPYELRTKKPFFHSSDEQAFYFENDKNWKSFWQENFNDCEEQEYIIHIK